MGTELFSETPDRVARWTRCRPNTACSPKRSSYPDDHSSVTYRLRANARWHDGEPVTADDVVYSFDTFKKNSPQLAAYYRHVTKAEKTGEREVTFTFDGPGQSRTAADRRPAAGAAEALVGRHRQVGQEARRHGDDAGAAARLRALPDQGDSCPGAASSTRRSPTIGARTSTSISAPITSRKSTSNISAIRPSRSRRFKADQVDWRTENSAKNWATAYDFPAVRDEPRGPGGIPDPQSRRDAGLRLQHPPRQVQGPARAPRLQFRLRLRRDEQGNLLRPVHAHRQLFRGHRARFLRHAGGPGAGNSADREGQGAARAVHAALHQSGRRQPADGAQQSARGAEAAARGRLRGARHQAGQRQDRRALHRRASGRRSRPSSASCCSTSRRSSGSA